MTLKKDSFVIPRLALIKSGIFSDLRLVILKLPIEVWSIVSFYGANKSRSYSFFFFFLLDGSLGGKFANGFKVLILIFGLGKTPSVEFLLFSLKRSFSSSSFSYTKTNLVLFLDIYVVWTLCLALSKLTASLLDFSSIRFILLSICKNLYIFSSFFFLLFLSSSQLLVANNCNIGRR